MPSLFQVEVVYLANSKLSQLVDSLAVNQHSKSQKEEDCSEQLLSHLEVDYLDKLSLALVKVYLEPNHNNQQVQDCLDKHLRQLQIQEAVFLVQILHNNHPEGSLVDRLSSLQALFLEHNQLRLNLCLGLSQCSNNSFNHKVRLLCQTSISLE